MRNASAEVLAGMAAHWPSLWAQAATCARAAIVHQPSNRTIIRMLASACPVPVAAPSTHSVATEPPFTPDMQVKGAYAHLENAQADVANMLNTKQFDLYEAFNARRSISNGVDLIQSIDPSAVPYTHLDTALQQATDAADALKRAGDYGFNQAELDGNAGPVNPNTVQLALSRQAFDSLEAALEALDNN